MGQDLGWYIHVVRLVSIANIVAIGALEQVMWQLLVWANSHGAQRHAQLSTDVIWLSTAVQFKIQAKVLCKLTFKLLQLWSNNPQLVL